MTAADAAGTPFGGATAPLRAKTVVTPGTHTVYLSIFDQGDLALDSAVFVDALRTTNESSATCVRGSQAIGPGLAITGPGVGFVSRSRFPTLTGTAGDGPGDAPTVTVRIFDGADTSGALRTALTATRSGASWSVTPTTPIPAGTYTAQASQLGGNGGTGVSRAGHLHDRAAGRPRPRRNPRRRGQPRRLAAAGARQVGRRARRLGHRPTSSTRRARRRAAVTPAAGFVPLKGAANIPIGSQLDTAKGRIALTSAADTGGKKTQKSDFYQGIFQVKQAVPKKKPKKAKALITDLVMKGQIAQSQCAPIKGAAFGGGQQEEGPQGGARPAVGQRQGQVPHLGQVQLRDGPRHHLARAGSLRGHADQGHPRHGPGGGLQAPQDGDREGRPQLPRPRPARGQQDRGTEEVMWAYA